MEYVNQDKPEILQVGSIDVTKQTSAINHNPQRDSAVCYYNGSAYSTGASVCSNGSLLVCNSSGAWDVSGSC
ncbi:MAG: DUF1496 domain-containing protein [Cyanobacteria bacterium CRU_2_1]|nr:DUF1496 domain-containing protein [Cyanobacteria bacterium CRU_2_1]